MQPYVIDRSANPRRQKVEEWLFGLDLVSSSVREDIITAWVTSWSSSSHKELADMPLTSGVDYPLIRHVNEVTRCGIALAEKLSSEWNVRLSDDILLPILILHDVDKPLMYNKMDGVVAYSEVSKQIPHGVLGAMILKELGFPHPVVSTVATHAANAPFHGSNLEALVLHYADLFAADYVLLQYGKTPLYQRLK